MSNPPAFPETPILSIIQLNLHPGCGIQNGGQPATRLWNASLDYVCSIPGSTAIYWAPLKDDPETLIILLQWEDAYSWRQFQESVGFSLMRGLLTRNYLFNRSARLALPDISQHSDLELVTFQFKRDTSSERKQQFEEAWKDLRQSANGNSNSDVIICGEWVERDGPNPNYPNWQAQVSKSDSQAMYFLAFLFWRPGVRYSDSGSLRQKAAALTEVPDDSRSILTCSLRREMKANPEEAQIITPIKSTSSLLSTPIARKYRTNDRFDFSYDPIAFKSYHDMRANKRLHFCPRGVNIAMGHLHQNPGPIHPLGSSQDVFDLFWLKKTMEEEQPAPWQDLQKKNITLLPADVYTGQSEDQPDHLALLICKWFYSHFLINRTTDELIPKVWKSHEKRSDHVDDMNHSVKQFASTSNCVIESEQSFCGGSPGWSTKEVYIEIVIFYIPLNSSIQMTKDLFETVYYDFERYVKIPES